MATDGKPWAELPIEIPKEVESVGGHKVQSGGLVVPESPD